MLNPSKANVLKTDETIMKITNYLIDNNYGGIDVVNLYAYMYTKSEELKNREGAYESLNNEYILDVVRLREFTIIAGIGQQKICNA